MESLTSREAILLAENVRLRRLLADAGLMVTEADVNAAAAPDALATALAESRQDARNARESMRKVKEAAAQAATDHQNEMEAHQAEALHQNGLSAALHTSESRLRLILDSASDFAIFATDLAGMVRSRLAFRA